ncbi:hypothetical protein QNH39_24930 [Neobacillus novalis]|uniref:Uncharacterized protein n=1 Tax=Neobacillus novalis TaxID=220687 RepID=A0AA95MR81_9BACI|nr:hypothetical protein [Neobacillus novalis]WHY85806.1 hypothetical protein QNH39_24930 [Neobacillus novalis]
MIDLEKEAKRRLCHGKIKILEGYRTNVRQAISRLDESRTIVRAAYTANTRQVLC